MMEQSPRTGEKSIAVLPLERSLLQGKEYVERKQE